MPDEGTTKGVSTALIADQMSRLGRALHGQGFVHGLNPAQWMALRYFHGAVDQARTVMRFAEYYGSSRGTASQTISALVRKGHLRRLPNPAKRSSRLIEVTDQGRDLLDDDPQIGLIRALESLEPETRIRLSRDLNHLLGHLSSHSGGDVGES